MDRLGNTASAPSWAKVWSWCLARNPKFAVAIIFPPSCENIPLFAVTGSVFGKVEDLADGGQVVLVLA